MKSKILSISVAAYNVEKYIETLIEKIICTKNKDFIEVFIVDDGGSDSTLDIAKKYAEKYPDIIIPIHKDNGGWGSTINYAIKIANVLSNLRMDNLQIKKNTF